MLVVGGLQFVYSVSHVWQIVDNNRARYVFHIVGEIALLALIAVIGLAYARGRVRTDAEGSPVQVWARIHKVGLVKFRDVLRSTGQ
ncbi:hypothetical protein [Nonomuraea wenchangensis]|uniref:hypothetical protein n=1 Tax=Nonomuraea wenchangensis TaxID=568860 RepID=UPI0033ED214C